MKTTLAKVTGLALLAASFAFSGSLAYADTEDTTSIQILTFDAVGNPGEIIAALDCDTGDGMGSCPVETLVAADTATTVADAFDPAVLEATAEATADAAEPAIRSVDAIIAEVAQTAVIIVTGDTDAAITGDAGIAIEEPAQTAAIPVPATEPATEDKTTSDASLSQPNEEKAEASTAIVVEVTQSSTVAVPGQPVEDEPVVTGSISEPSSTTPVSMLDGNHGDEDF
jgi:hypothetical protein